MKIAYPIIIYEKDPQSQYYLVEIPDFEGYTQGSNLEECKAMARDYIQEMAREGATPKPDTHAPKSDHAVVWRGNVTVRLAPVKRTTRCKPVARTLRI